MDTVRVAYGVRAACGEDAGVGKSVHPERTKPVRIDNKGKRFIL
jgi:hypothetical protein